MSAPIPCVKCMSYIVSMRKVDLNTVDLNLLVALDALIEERSVTRAAIRLGISQPAASRALSRLRRLFADALLVDGRTGYILSARAQEIRPALGRTLADVKKMLETNPFDPAVAVGRVRLLMPDFQAAALAPNLIIRLANEAPALDLDILPLGMTVMEALENDAADVAVGVFDDAPAGILRRRLYEDGFVTLMRAGHPAADRKLTLDRFLQLDHIVVSITGVGPAPVDTALAGIGHLRRVKVRVPSFLAAVEIVARSDLIMTLPSILAQAAAGLWRFAVLLPPLDLGNFAMSLLWHARHQDEPRHTWLRDTIVAAAADLLASHRR